jgi:8-oxo-dGTP diphosphatase
MEITSFELSQINFDEVKYVVMIAEFNEKLVLIKNRNKILWELPGGKREKGEQLLKAASRELFEETGALHFELIPYGIYLMNGSYGMNFHVNILEMGKLPDYEIEEIRLSDTFPEGLRYGEIYYKMYDEWNRMKDIKRLRKYKVDYRDSNTTYAF